MKTRIASISLQLPLISHALLYRIDFYKSSQAASGGGLRGLANKVSGGGVVSAATQALILAAEGRETQVGPKDIRPFFTPFFPPDLGACLTLILGACPPPHYTLIFALSSLLLSCLFLLSGFRLAQGSIARSCHRPSPASDAARPQNVVRPSL